MLERKLALSRAREVRVSEHPHRYPGPPKEQRDCDKTRGEAKKHPWFEKLHGRGVYRVRGSTPRSRRGGKQAAVEELQDPGHAPGCGDAEVVSGDEDGEALRSEVGRKRRDFRGTRVVEVRGGLVEQE